ncbi:MAG: PilZ domain-containing protein [Planctomycetota bacterium]
MTEPERQDRRREGRIIEHCRVAFRVVEEGKAGPKTVAGETMDLSVSGLCLLAPVGVQPGSIVAIEVSLRGHAAPILAMGKVIWCNGEGPQRHRMGVAFSWVREEDRGALEVISDFVQEHLPEA